MLIGAAGFSDECHTADNIRRQTELDLESVGLRNSLVVLHHPRAMMIFRAMSWMITFLCQLLTCTPASLTGGNNNVIAFPT